MPQPRDPHSYRVTVERPDDFDSFWADIMGESAELPLNATLEHLPARSTEQVDTYAIGYDSIDGVRVAGWYCVPKESYLPPPYPAVLLVPGYISEPDIPKAWAALGYAAVGVAPRGKLRSNSQYNPGYPGLLTHNIIDKNTYSYRGFYVDAVRAVDFVLDRPEVDSERIGVYGSSQGGALTIVTAALRSDVITCGAAGAPYLCGFMDSAKLCMSYPYEEINEYLRANPDHEPLVRETVAYFDGINFAPKVTAPMFVYIGMEDDVCPPETGLAVHEALAGPKELHTHEGCAHDAGSYWMAGEVVTFLAKHLNPALAATPG